MDLTDLMHKLRKVNPNGIIYAQYSENDDCFKYWVGEYLPKEDNYEYYEMFDCFDDLVNHICGLEK
jgi:hypothetical protein